MSLFSRTSRLLLLLVILVSCLAIALPGLAATANAPFDPTPIPANVSYGIYIPVVSSSSGITNIWPPTRMQTTSLNTNLEWGFANTRVAQPRFTVYLEAEDATPDVAVVTDTTRTTYDPSTLELDTVYFWQVIVTDASSPTVQIPGDIWQYQTETAEPPELAAMVQVPGGPFWMGCDASNPNESACSYNVHHQDEPVRLVNVNAFEIDKYEVTNQEYRACVDAGACERPRVRYEFDRPEYALHPVIFVSWWDAQTYCAWEGKRLPTEAEWEKAARGTMDTRKWPWGNEPADCTRVNSNFYREGENCNLLEQGTTPVGRYPRGASPYGAHDVSGNVFEWVQDKYDVLYYNYSPTDNPQGPPYSRVNKTFGDAFSAPGEDELGYPVFTIRSGSWRDSRIYLRVVHRHWGHHGDDDTQDVPYFRSDRLGFRCAR